MNAQVRYFGENSCTLQVSNVRKETKCLLESTAKKAGMTVRVQQTGFVFERYLVTIATHPSAAFVELVAAVQA